MEEQVTNQQVEAPTVEKKKKGKKGKEPAPIAQLPKINPALNVNEKGKGITATMEVPGLKRKDLEVRATITSLTVRGRKMIDKPGKKERAFISEIENGRFERTVELPAEINVKNIKARLNKGLFQVSMRKKNVTTKKHKVKVK